jgi:sulfite reductase (NADPH) flavoprotein alpha-component
MVSYFGYGSNINIISLRAKGVNPVSSRRGILRGWVLKFNVQHWFPHEGGMGNIQPSPDIRDCVEGMVHICADNDLASLDLVESYGVGYDRVEVGVETDTGPVKCQAYIGLPAFIDDTCLPTRRYLNIIISGGETAGLSPPYLGKLRSHPVLREEDYPAFEHPSGDFPVFNELTLAANPFLTALAGAVFDMRGARARLDCLHVLLGGKDMTVFYLKRHDTSRGTETIGDFINGRITDGQKRYLNAYLRAYLKEYRYAGRYVYEGI